ncbi:hypothetical protein Ssi03_55360 [Sphaerisporangium siamense]|uniref:Putative TIM-barrel enzyme n=1 Tax=Sphaerisporangium siamense TaxID=795645 RepID=A0A7W7DCE8_9ACTN|nr:hypothetical protein [Sphaerisporangium siamense]MBB4703460.1 putative TIM-barrel enzyme [Sphaerisporangium siamense]GII87546.1 hypothetical protein Ssi03_55360 [Sphaerisporangium siamense]
MSTGRAPRIHPVIHVAGVAQMLAEIGKAVAHDVDGVFLIDHDADDARLFRCVAAARERHPGLFLGANVIKRGPHASLALLHEAFPGGVPLDALWTDRAAVGLGGPEPEFERFAALRAGIGWHGLQFGGVAFKYQDPVPDAVLPDLARAVRDHVDVPTTSGPGTGQAAGRAKLEALRSGLGDRPLALASGVTPDNVRVFADLVDHILVSTGVNAPSGGIDERLLAALLRAVREER